MLVVSTWLVLGKSLESSLYTPSLFKFARIFDITHQNVKPFAENLSFAQSKLGHNTI